MRLIRSLDSVSLKGMKPGFWIFSLLLPAWLFSQTPRIENLKKVIPWLKDSVRVDSMNELCLQFTEQSIKDSAEYYADKAYSESKSLNYIHGLAESLGHKGNMETFFYGNLSEAEKAG